MKHSSYLRKKDAYIKYALKLTKKKNLEALLDSNGFFLTRLSLTDVIAARTS